MPVVTAGDIITETIEEQGRIIEDVFILGFSIGIALGLITGLILGGAIVGLITCKP